MFCVSSRSSMRPIRIVSPCCSTGGFCSMRRIFSAALSPNHESRACILATTCTWPSPPVFTVMLPAPDETSTVIAPLETFKVRSKPPVSEAAACQTHVPKIRRSRPRFLADFIAFLLTDFPVLLQNYLRALVQSRKQFGFRAVRNTNRHRHFLPAVFVFRIWYLDGCVAVFVINYVALVHD